MADNEKELFLQKYLLVLKTKVQSLMNEIINLETQLALSNDKVNSLAQELGEVKEQLEKLNKKKTKE